MNASATTPQPPPLKLTPLTSLELRLRQLEFLVSGAVSSSERTKSDVSSSSTTNLLRRVLEVQNELERAVEGRSSLERFLDTYTTNLPLLAPKFSLSHLGLSSEDDSDLVPLETKLALVLDGEGDITEVLRGLEEIELLENKGVLDAGDLNAHHELSPRLASLLPPHQQILTSFADLEARLIQLLGRYDDYISTISATFLDLNTLLTSAEDQVSRLERKKKEEAAGML